MMRLLKLEAEMIRYINQFLHLNDLHFYHITKARYSKDLQFCKVYTILRNDSTLEDINAKQYKIFCYLRRIWKGKFVPKIKFVHDAEYLQQNKVLDLISNEYKTSN